MALWHPAIHMQLTAAGQQMIFEDNHHNCTIIKADPCLQNQNTNVWWLHSFTDMPDLWVQRFELLTKLELLVHEEIVFINIVSVAFHLLYYTTVCFLGEFDVLFSH